MSLPGGHVPKYQATDQAQHHAVSLRHDVAITTWPGGCVPKKPGNRIMAVTGNHICRAQLICSELMCATATNNGVMMEPGQIYFRYEPEETWRVRLYGNTFIMVEEKHVPNRFWRFMQWAAFGFQWERIDG